MKILFYKIDPHWINEKDIYSFPLFVFDKKTNERIVYAYPEIEIEIAHKAEMEIYVKKGAEVQIYHEFIDEALEKWNIDHAQLEQLNKEKVDFVRLVNKRKSDYEELFDKEFNLKETVRSANNRHSYEKLRERVRVDLLKFPLDEDPVMNFTLCLIENVFTRDLMAVKNAVLAYFISLEVGLKDPKIICEILLAALLKDVGLCMVPPSAFTKYEILTADDFYLKHPFLSLYYLSKLDLSFSKDLKRLIMEHHEDTRGEGFPRGKKEDFIAMPSFILNLAEQIVLQSEEKSGAGVDLVKSLNLFNCSTAVGEMNLNIPQHILEALSGIAPSET